MGSLFLCDGNCGGSFHPQCVGLDVQGEYGGEGGARLERTFVLPEGEWYVTRIGEFLKCLDI